MPPCGPVRPQVDPEREFVVAIDGRGRLGYRLPRVGLSGSDTDPDERDDGSKDDHEDEADPDDTGTHQCTTI